MYIYIYNTNRLYAVLTDQFSFSTASVRLSKTRGQFSTFIVPIIPHHQPRRNFKSQIIAVDGDHNNIVIFERDAQWTEVT